MKVRLEMEIFKNPARAPCAENGVLIQYLVAQNAPAHRL